MHTMKLKVLEVPNGMASDGFFTEEDIVECYGPAITPILHRPGLYFDRLTGGCWFETAQGKAYKYNPTSFAYELSLLDVWQRYSARQIAAISHAIRERVASPEQKHISHRYESASQIRNTYRRSVMWRKRVIGR